MANPLPRDEYMRRLYEEAAREQRELAERVRAGQVGPDNWKLEPEHASALVRSRYLDPLADAGRDDLFFLSRLAELELRTPVDAVGPRGLTPLVEAGLLLEESGSFRLAHPGLGRLILQAAVGKQGPTLADSLLRLARRARNEGLEG